MLIRLIRGIAQALAVPPLFSDLDTPLAKAEAEYEVTETGPEGVEPTPDSAPTSGSERPDSEVMASAAVVIELFSALTGFEEAEQALVADLRDRAAAFRAVGD